MIFFFHPLSKRIYIIRHRSARSVTCSVVSALRHCRMPTQSAIVERCFLFLFPRIREYTGRFDLPVMSCGVYNARAHSAILRLLILVAEFVLDLIEVELLAGGAFEYVEHV